VDGMSPTLCSKIESMTIETENAYNGALASRSSVIAAADSSLTVIAFDAALIAKICDLEHLCRSSHMLFAASNGGNIKDADQEALEGVGFRAGKGVKEELLELECENELTASAATGAEGMTLGRLASALEAAGPASS